MGAATNIAVCPLLFAGHPNRAAECPLSGVKRTLNSCSPISIYGYTTYPPGGTKIIYAMPKCGAPSSRAHTYL